jgi:hypothetical protein
VVFELLRDLRGLLFGCGPRPRWAVFVFAAPPLGEREGFDPLPRIDLSRRPIL